LLFSAVGRGAAGANPKEMRLRPELNAIGTAPDGEVQFLRTYLVNLPQGFANRDRVFLAPEPIRSVDGETEIIGIAMSYRPIAKLVGFGIRKEQGGRDDFVRVALCQAP
jgi:hypothetical protein